MQAKWIYASRFWMKNENHIISTWSANIIVWLQSCDSRAFSRIAYNAHYHQIHLAHFVKIIIGIGYIYGHIWRCFTTRTSVEWYSWKCIFFWLFHFSPQFSSFMYNAIHSLIYILNFCSNRAPCTHYQYDILYRKYRVVWCVWCGCLTPFCVFFICIICYIQLIACISGFSE